MEKGYNLYNLEPQFRKFLLAENVSLRTLKNYLSDFRYFAGWIELYLKNQINSKPISINFSQFELITVDLISKYKDYLLANNLPHKSINRRLSTIRKFCSFCILQGWMKENPAKKISNIGQNFKEQLVDQQNIFLLESGEKASISPKDIIVSTLSFFKNSVAGFKNKFKFNKTSSSNSTLFLDNQSLGIQYYVAFLIVLVFVATLGAGIYNQFFLKTERTFAYPTAPVRAGRLLSFQGRLTDTLGNPITTATNVTFKLYNISSGGSPLYTAGACSLTPDQDGIFNVLIGGSGYSPTPPQAVCGSEVDSSIFSENVDIYMGITVASDSEMTPRQQIANVGYAINSETLQGLPPGSTVSTIPYINDQGNVLIAAASPGIRSTYASNTFTVSSAHATTIQSASTGDIVLQATESGALKFRTGGSTDTENRLVVDSSGNTTVTNQGDLRLAEPTGAGTNYVGLQAPDTLAGDTVYKLPDAFPGAASGYYLTSNTSGDMSWSNSISASSLKWNALTVPDGNLTLAMDADTTTFNWDTLTTGTGWTAASTSLSSGTLEALSVNSTAATGNTQKVLSLSTAGTNATSTQTTYGLYATNTHTGTTSTNVAGYFSASGGTNNYAGIFDGGNVGIGTTAPGYKLHLQGGSLALQDGSTSQLTSNTSYPIIYTSAVGSAGSYPFESVGNLIIQGRYNATYGGSTVFYNGTNASPTMSLTRGALVGIGTTDPDAKLDVLATSGEQLRLTYTDGTVHTGFTVDLGGDLTIAPSGGDLLITGNIDTSGTLKAGTSDAFSVDASGNTTIDNQSDIRLSEPDGAGTNYVGLQAPDTLAGDTVYKLPDAFPGAASGYYLTSNTSGDMSWSNSISASSLKWNALTDPDGNLGPLTMATYSTTFNWDAGADAALTSMSLSAQGEDTTGTGDQEQILLALSQATNGASNVDEGLDALLTLANYDGNDEVQNAIRFDTGAAGVDFIYGINFDAATIGTAELMLQNSERIDNVTDGTINLTTGTLKISGGTDLVSDQLSVNLFNATTTTLTVGGALTTLDLADSATTKTIHLGGVTNSGTDTISIATNGTAADTLEIGNSNASTLLTLTGGDDWSISNTGNITAAALFDSVSYPNYGIDPAGTANFGGYSLKITGGALLAYDSGNVGIGATSPAGKLDVKSTQTSGTLGLYGAPSAVSLAGALTGLNIDLSTNYTATGFGVTGQTIALPAVTNTGAGTYAYKGLSVTGGALIQNTGAGTDTWTGLDVTMPNITETTGSITSTGLKITGGTVTSGTSYALITDSNAGNVGIGNSGPDGQLDIKSATTKDLNLVLDTTDADNSTSDSWILFQEAGTTKWRLGNDGDSGDDFELSAGGTTPVFLVESGGNVGIGDTSPAALFTVGSGDLFQINSSGIITAIDGAAHTIEDVAGALSLNSAGNELIIDASDTKLTATGVNTLDMAATVAWDVTTLTLGGSAKIIGGTATTGDLYLQTTSGIGTTGADMHFLVGNNGATEAMTILNSGYVGIGDTSPDATLEVTGDIWLSEGANRTIKVETRSANDLAGNDLTITGGSAAGASLGSPTGGDVIIDGGVGFGDPTPIHGDVLLATNRGYVGIGDTTPSYLLDVAGAIGIGYGSAGLVFTTGDFIDASNTIANNMVIAGRNDVNIFIDTYNNSADTFNIYPVNSSGTLAFQVTEAGRIYGGSFSASGTSALCWDNSDGSFINDCNGTPIADYAEIYPTTADVEYGDIVTTSNETVRVKKSEGTDIVNNEFVNVAKLTKATTSDNSIIGIVSNNYGDFTSTGHNIVNDADHPMPVALNGRVPVKISANSTSINIGDAIISSNEPGRGMKAIKVGRIVGHALEPWDPANPKDKIIVFVENTYYDPDIYLTSIGNLEIKNDSETPYVYDGSQTENSQFSISNFQSIFNDQIYNVKTKTGETITRIGAFSEVITGKIKAGLVETENAIVSNILIAQNIIAENISSKKIISPIIETENIIATGTAQLNTIQTNEIKPVIKDVTIDLTDSTDSTNKGSLAKLIIKGLEGKSAVVIDSAGNASFSGQIVADSLQINNDATVSGKLIANELQTNDASVSGKLIANEIESNTINDIQKLIADIQTQPLPDPNNYQNLSDQQYDNITIEQLTVTNNSNLYNLTVSGSILTGTTLIEQNSIISLSSELKLSALEKINLLDGAVIIAKDGTITTKGELIAEKGIRTNEIKPLTENGQVTINQLTTNQLSISDKYLDATSSAAIIAAPDNFAKNGIFAPAIETATSSAGIALLPENSSEVIIYNHNIKKDSLVYLTPIDSAISSQLSVVDKEDCSQQSNNETIELCKKYFKVIINSPSTLPTKFNWLIIN